MQEKIVSIFKRVQCSYVQQCSELFNFFHFYSNIYFVLLFDSTSILYEFRNEKILTKRMKITEKGKST